MTSNVSNIMSQGTSARNTTIRPTSSLTSSTETRTSISMTSQKRMIMSQKIIMTMSRKMRSMTSRKEGSWWRNLPRTLWGSQGNWTGNIWTQMQGKDWRRSLKWSEKSWKVCYKFLNGSKVRYNIWTCFVNVFITLILFESLLGLYYNINKCEIFVHDFL